MIIKEQGIRKGLGATAFLYAAVVAIGAILLVWGAQALIGPTQQASTPFPLVLGDAESIDTTENGVFFRKGETLFINGQTHSDKRARSGAYSSMLDKQNKFGIGYRFENPVPGERFKVSVWRYGNRGDGGALIIQGTGNSPFYLQEAISSKTDEEGWGLLERVFQIPPDYQEGNITAYIFGSGRNQVFFDDLTIEKVEGTDDFSIVTDSQVSVLNLKIEPDAWAKLVQKREDARLEGFLVTEEDDWVKAEILEETGNVPIKMRLKGDLLDHITKSKWSFRIKVKTPHAWNRMTTFSVHTPTARAHLMEWVYHRLLEKEGVLTPRYSFIMLRVNGKNLGVYACEEHFVKQLPEYKSRREGPIVRMEEEGVWLARKQASDYQEDWGFRERTLKSYEAARIQPFDEKRTVGDSALIQQFEVAQNLLHQHKFNLNPPSELFDIDLLAKYYAISDLTQAYHGIIWHNERFYYNPVISKLEPIGFDGYTATGVFNWIKKPFIGSRVSRTNGEFIGDRINSLFLDPVFAEKYYHYLYTFTSKSYINEFMMDLEAEIQREEKTIRIEFSDYTYDREFLVKHAKDIHHLLEPVEDAAIAAYTESKNNGQQQIRLSNFHLTALQVTGWGTSNQGADQSLKTPVFLPGYESNRLPVYHEISLPLKARFVYYQVPGIDQVYRSRLLPWKTPTASTPAQELFQELRLPAENTYRITQKEIRFAPGEIVVDTDIIIPEGYVVRMSPGTRMNLTKGARFISRSPVQLLGTEDQPIAIFSSDKSGQGFTILQAAGPSEMRYVSFTDLTTLSYKGWNLTGAVTFYESDVEIDHCAFQKAHCEDGLNLVRCEFSLSNSVISDTYSDGFDADFCTGKVENTRFLRTGNDGMDFSGSVIQVLDSEVIGAGDKGLSAGEEATIRANNLVISGSVTGVAAKDLSKLLIGKISLRDCTTGFAAYQKKPEFGGGIITVDSYEAEAVKYLHIIEKNSSLSLAGNQVESI